MQIIRKFLILLLFMTSSVLLSCNKNEVTPSSIGMIKFDLDEHPWETEIVYWTDPKGDPNQLVFKGVKGKEYFSLNLYAKANVLIGNTFYENEEVFKDFIFSISASSIFTYISFISLTNSITLEKISIEGDFIEGYFSGTLVEIKDNGTSLGNRTAKITNGYFKIRIDSISKR